MLAGIVECTALPAMTKVGNPKRLAAAVEAVASSGGQIMPPLMGAGAFVMVELTGVPFTGNMPAAALLALLYFVAVWMGINTYTRRFSLKSIAEADRPALRDVVITSLFFLVPFSVLLWGMFVAQFTPVYSAAMAILAATVLLFVNARLTFLPRQIADRLASAVLNAARQMALIASIIIGVLSSTGLGVKINSLILEGSGGLLWLSLLLTALACLILGWRCRPQRPM